MALDLCQNFVLNWVSAQYLENRLIEFNHNFYRLWFWQDLGWDCYLTLFIYLQICIGVTVLDWCQNFIYLFANLYRSYGPWLMSEFCFRSISLEQTERVSSNLDYALIITWSRLGVLFFTILWLELRLWLMSEFCFSSISWDRMDIFDQISHMHWYRQDLGLHVIILLIYNRVMALN